MRRLDATRRWLRDARPLAETAVEAGFAEQAHFTRTFKAAFGMTPGRYVKLSAAHADDAAARATHCGDATPGRNLVGRSAMTRRSPRPELRSSALPRPGT